jgi:hypothetical protein
MPFRRSSSTAVKADKSSLESGMASIIAKSPRRNLPPSQASTAWSEGTLSPENPIDVGDMIDLQSGSSSTRMSRTSIEDSLASVLAAAIQMTSVPLKQRSSLSSGRASVIMSSSRTQQDLVRRNSNSSSSSDESLSPKTPTSRRPLSSYLFYTGKKASSADAPPTKSEANDRESVQGDTFGLKDLLDRGIHVKEISTTMKKMVVPDDILNPMPQVIVERPRFAR